VPIPPPPPARQELARAHRVASRAGLFGGARAGRAGQRVDVAGAG
jgi:hypothetical protein